MLILERNLEESILIYDGDPTRPLCKITALRFQLKKGARKDGSLTNARIWLGFESPPNITIVRQELLTQLTPRQIINGRKRKEPSSLKTHQKP